MNDSFNIDASFNESASRLHFCPLKEMEGNKQTKQCYVVHKFDIKDPSYLEKLAKYTAKGFKIVKNAAVAGGGKIVETTPGVAQKVFESLANLFGTLRTLVSTDQNNKEESKEGEGDQADKDKTKPYGDITEDWVVLAKPFDQRLDKIQDGEFIILSGSDSQLPEDYILYDPSNSFGAVDSRISTRYAVPISPHTLQNDENMQSIFAPISANCDLKQSFYVIHKEPQGKQLPQQNDCEQTEQTEQTEQLNPNFNYAPPRIDYAYNVEDLASASEKLTLDFLSN